jgi:hypothetical protein
LFLSALDLPVEGRESLGLQIELLLVRTPDKFPNSSGERVSDGIVSHHLQQRLDMAIRLANGALDLARLLHRKMARVVPVGIGEHHGGLICMTDNQHAELVIVSEAQ